MKANAWQKGRLVVLALVVWSWPPRCDRPRRGWRGGASR